MRITVIFLVLCSIISGSVEAVNVPKDSIVKPFRISVLLPFFSSKYNPDSEMILSSSFPDEAKTATEYYYGIKMALDSIRKAGYDVTLHIYDTGDDSIKVKRILHTDFVTEADLILVASNQKQEDYAVLNCVELFGRRTHKPVFEVVNSNNFVPGRPDSTFYILNARAQTHARLLLDYVRPKKGDVNVCLVTSPDKDSNNVNTYAEACRFYKLPFDTVTYRHDSLFKALQDKMSLIDTNIIVLPFTKEETVKAVLADLQNISRDYKFQIIGMPDWRWFKYNTQTFVLPVNVCLTTATWQAKSNPVYKRLENQYRKMVNRPLTDNVLMGFEQTVWLTNLHFKAGDSLSQKITATVYSGLASKYKLTKRLNANGDCLYVENANVYIIKPYYTGFKKVR